MQKLLLVYYSQNRSTSQIWNVLSNMVFPSIWGEKWRRSEHAHASYSGLSLDSSFARPGSAPIRGGKKGEFGDWTNTKYIYTIIMSMTLKVTGNHVKFARFLLLPVSEEAKTWLPYFLSEAEGWGWLPLPGPWLPKGLWLIVFGLRSL